MSRIEVWHASGTPGRWTRRGYSDRIISPPDDFVSFVTKPTATNVGNRVPETSLELVGTGGTIEINTPNTTISRKIFNGPVRVRADYVDFDECLFVMPHLTGITKRYGIRCWDGTVGTRVTRSSFIVPPENRTYLADAAIHGVGFELDRCYTEGFVDGAMVYGEGSIGPASITNNYFGSLIRYDYDGDHADGTHNDDLQAMARITNLLIRNNNFGTAKSSCLLISRANATYTYHDITIDDNQFRIQDPLFGSFINLANIAPSNITGTLSIQRNVFPTPEETNKVRILIKPDVLATAHLYSNGPNRNVYSDDSGRTVPIWYGTGGLVYSYNEV